jgi:hypothetical protein
MVGVAFGQRKLSAPNYDPAKEITIQGTVQGGSDCGTSEELQAVAGPQFDIHLRLGPVGHVVREAAPEQGADLIPVSRGAIQKGLGRLRSSAAYRSFVSPLPSNHSLGEIDRP